MPEVLDRCVKSLMRKGYSKDRAYAICVKSTGWKRGKGGKWVKMKEEYRLWVSPYEEGASVEDWFRKNFPNVDFQVEDELISESFHGDQDIWYCVTVSDVDNPETFLQKLNFDFSVIQEKVPEKILAWRRRQKPGKIMKPSTFKEIERKAREAGYDDPKAVAGAAYWKTVKAKYRETQKKQKKGD